MAKPANKTKAKPAAKPAAKSKSAPKAKAKPVVKASKPAPKKAVKPASKPSAQKAPVKKAAKAPAKAPTKAAAKAPAKAVKAPAKPAPKVSKPPTAVKSATKPSSVKSKKPVPPPVPVKKTVAKTLVKKAPSAPVKADKVVSVRTTRGKTAPATTKKAAPREIIPTVVFPTKNPHSKIFLSLQKQRLLELKDELVDSMTGMASETLRSRAQDSEASAFGMHQADAGSDAYDRDFTLSLLSQEQDALYEIEEALKRIDAGTYGICEMSGKTIIVDRLEVRPYARFTVECQEMVDKEYGPNSLRRGIRSLFGLGTDEDDEDGDEDSADEKDS